MRQADSQGIKISYQKRVTNNTKTQAKRGEVISKRKAGGRSWESAHKPINGITNQGSIVATRRDHF